MTDIIISGYAKDLSEGGSIGEQVDAADVLIGQKDHEKRGESGGDLDPVPPLLPASAGGFSTIEEGDDVYTPAPAENQVVAGFRKKGLYVGGLGDGLHSVTCPWAAEHSADASDATYLEPEASSPIGQFRCDHVHTERRDTASLLDYLGLTTAAARSRPRIRIEQGEVHRITGAAERVLNAEGTYFHAGGPLVRVVVDPISGDVSTETVNDQTLTSLLASKIDWEKRSRPDGWARADPPASVVQMLLRGQDRQHLRALAGLARQPFFRADGTLVTVSGYDDESGIFSAFDTADYDLPEPTREAAQKSLDYLNWLIGEFHFATEADRSAALCAMLTAAIRTSLPLAPAFSITAARPGSGKSYLAKLITALAGPGEPHNVSFPTTPDEATKAVLALLMERPMAILFDDMQGDWKPFGALNKMLTSSTITERVLGTSRTATARTNVLIIGSGNNIEPARDMRRRVVTLSLAPPSETPAVGGVYGRNPIEIVRRNRAHAVKAALTIVMAFQAAGRPVTDVSNIGSFEDWSMLCRQPLLWLGEADPATSIIAQVMHDPDQDRLGELLAAIFEHFRSAAIPVRKILEKAADNHDLMDALLELPVTEGRHVSPGKLGWFLSKNCGRSSGPFRLEKAESSQRTAYRVELIDPSAVIIPHSQRDDVF